MKLRCTIWFGVISLALLRNVSAQGFVNLDFESATIIPVSGDPYNRIEFTPAFPGWTGYTGTNVQTLALFSVIFLDSSGIGLTGGLSGYGAMLEAGNTLTSPLMPADTTLSQTGLVPPGTQSLLFYGDFYSELNETPNDFAVTLNGQALSLIPFGTDSGYTLYGADISSWAGQTATLAFTVFAQRPHHGNNYLYLDDIQFSPSAVPEPSVLSLLSVCILLLCWHRRLSNTAHGVRTRIQKHIQEMIYETL